MLTRFVFAITLFAAGVLAGRALDGLREPREVRAQTACIEGDVNEDGVLDLTDPITLLNHLFIGGPAPRTCWRGDLAGASLVVLVRHAEREPGGCEAILRPEGEERARALARVLEVARVDALIASDCIRTRLTLEPLASAKGGLSIREVVAAGDVVGEIGALPAGGVAVVAHHSFTIHDIMIGLGLPDSVREIPVAGDQHDDFFVIVRRSDGPPELLHLKFPPFLAAPPPPQ